MAIGEAIARRGIRKQYYLETRGDVLLRNKDVFRFWKTLGLQYMFLGVEAIDEEGLKRFRKRVTLSKNFEAIEFARSLGIMVALNIIADPDWDHRQFEVIRQWCLEIPEIVNISVNTPYPGTESWLTESRRITSRDYRLFDIQHAVLPTRLPLAEFYGELVRTQQVLNRKHLGWSAVKALAGILAGNLARGQTNTLKMLWKFNSVYNPQLQISDHQQPVRYEMAPPPPPIDVIDPRSIYIHPARGRPGRMLDASAENFVQPVEAEGRCRDVTMVRHGPSSHSSTTPPLRHVIRGGFGEARRPSRCMCRSNKPSAASMNSPTARIVATSAATTSAPTQVARVSKKPIPVIVMMGKGSDLGRGEASVFEPIRNERPIRRHAFAIPSVKKDAIRMIFR